MKVIYAGIFFDEKESSKLISKSSKILDKKINNPHVTLQFGGGECLPKEIIGQKVILRVVGEGSTEDNQGFEIIIPDKLNDFYKGASTPHITISVSQKGKPINTKDVIFNKIESFEIVGKIGYFTNEGVIF